MALTIGFLLLTFVDLWTSPNWRARTALPAAPWVPNTRFDENQVLAISDVTLAQAIQAWSDKVRSKHNQRDKLAVYNGNVELREKWRSWIRIHSRKWRLNDTIDNYLKNEVGWDLVGFMRQTHSRVV
jgi:hypothetical protein